MNLRSLARRLPPLLKKRKRFMRLSRLPKVVETNSTSTLKRGFSNLDLLCRLELSFPSSSDLSLVRLVRTVILWIC